MKIEEVVKPTTAEVMTPVPAIESGDSPARVMESLRTHRVAILVGSDRKPQGVLTMCDIDAVLDRAEKLKSAGKGSAADLFATPMAVYTVAESTPVEAVADRLAQHGLGTGIVVVDSPGGAYRGYVFNDQLREKLSRFVSDARSSVLPTLAQFALRS